MKGFKAHDMYLGKNNKKWSHKKPSGKHAHVVAKNETAHNVLMDKKSAFAKSYRRNDGLNKSASFSHKSFDDMNWRERRIVRKEERKRGANNKQYSDTSGPSLGQRIRNFF